MATKLVVVIGVGSVGSQLAEELAINGVGRLRLFDGKTLKEHHLARHTLTKGYVGQNKAAGMEKYFSQEVPTLKVEARPWQLLASASDEMVDGLLQDADLIVVATDDRQVQRMVGRRALALDIPAIFPGLYERNGGEVFVQRSPRWPCFFCRDGFRPTGEALRGVSATNPDILGIIALASRLSLGLLDPSTDYLQRLMRPSAGEVVSPQLFIDNGLGLARRAVPWRKDCPSCEVGPSSLRPDAVEAWRTAERARMAAMPEFQELQRLWSEPPAPVSAPPGATESEQLWENRSTGIRTVPITRAVSVSLPSASYEPPFHQRSASPAKPIHPAASRSSNSDPGDLIASGLGVLLWWFFFTEGFDGFRFWWNPIAWIAVVGWFFYAFSD